MKADLIISGDRDSGENTAVPKVFFKDMTYDEISSYFFSIGEKRFRADQIFKRMYVDGVSDFESITEFSSELQRSLDEKTSISCLTKEIVQSADDGTKKYLFGINGGYFIESVFMKYKYGNTACISSQAGCRMGCMFCASGIDGLQRNLTAGEMLDQIVIMQDDTQERIGHVVVMGTGEPFDNYDQLIKAISIMHDKRGLNIGLRNITVSTCGILNKIDAFAKDLPQVNLAISLHAPDQELRRRLMPVARSYDMDDLIKVCRNYTYKTHRRITFEYALIQGVNDSLKQAEKLVNLIKGMLCHVNLIPLNDVSEKNVKGTERNRVEQFYNVISSHGIEVTIRRELGGNINAACGQLRSSVKNSNIE